MNLHYVWSRKYCINRIDQPWGIAWMPWENITSCRFHGHLKRLNRSEPMTGFWSVQRFYDFSGNLQCGGNFCLCHAISGMPCAPITTSHCSHAMQIQKAHNVNNAFPPVEVFTDRKIASLIQYFTRLNSWFKEAKKKNHKKIWKKLKKKPDAKDGIWSKRIIICQIELSELASQKFNFAAREIGLLVCGFMRMNLWVSSYTFSLDETAK